MSVCYTPLVAGENVACEQVTIELWFDFLLVETIARALPTNNGTELSKRIVNANYFSHS